MNLLGFRWAGLAMAVAMAMGASVDVSRGTRGAGLCVSSGSPYQARGLGLVVLSFPRALRSYDLNSRCRRQPRRGLAVLRASNNNGPEFDDQDKNEGKKGSVDWDKAWESFPKPKKQNPWTNLLKSLNIDMEQYVNRRPTHSNFPLSEETDPMRKTERKALDAWTDPKFTLAGVGVVVGLFVYMVVIVGPPPS